MPDLGLSPLDEHNRTLLHLVHPAGWKNPEPARRYNLVVVGAGTAGLVTASGAAGLGARVALVERHLMGGDCLNVGCVPSKALLRAARAASETRNAGTFGVRTGSEPVVDFGAAMERMRRLRAQIAPADSALRYAGLGVDVFLGEGRFTSPDSLEVGGSTLHFARACIATGARPFVPEIPGLREAGFLTNETVFNLTELPRRLLVIGGGPIGCELAQAFRRFGSEVHLVEPSAHLLVREDRDAAEVLRRVLVREGVVIHDATSVSGIGASGGARTATLLRDGIRSEVACDQILVATGRAPNVAGMGLEAAGVQFDARTGVHVGDDLLTTNPRIYAAGDVASRHKFTHAADFLARIVIENALFKTGLLSLAGRKKASALVIPRCTYTDPEIAAVGAGERELADAGIPHRTFTQPLEHVDRALLDGEEDGFVKVHVEATRDRILGATLVARHAGEMIGELTLAISRGVGLGALSGVIHPYPTQAEAIRKVGDLYNRTRLTPRAKAFSTWLLARRR